MKIWPISSAYLVLCVLGVYGFIIPDEIPTILSVIYSNIPRIRAGTDSRLGWGFKLGDRADFQVQMELGPQQYTQTLTGDQTKISDRASLWDLNSLSGDSQEKTPTKPQEEIKSIKNITNINENISEDNNEPTKSEPKQNLETTSVKDLIQNSNTESNIKLKKKDAKEHHQMLVPNKQMSTTSERNKTNQRVAHKSKKANTRRPQYSRTVYKNRHQNQISVQKVQNLISNIGTNALKGLIRKIKAFSRNGRPTNQNVQIVRKPLGFWNNIKPRPTNSIYRNKYQNRKPNVSAAPSVKKLSMPNGTTQLKQSNHFSIPSNIESKNNLMLQLLKKLSESKSYMKDEQQTNSKINVENLVSLVKVVQEKQKQQLKLARQGKEMRHENKHSNDSLMKQVLPEHINSRTYETNMDDERNDTNVPTQENSNRKHENSQFMKTYILNNNTTSEMKVLNDLMSRVIGKLVEIKDEKGDEQEKERQKLLSLYKMVEKKKMELSDQQGGDAVSGQTSMNELIKQDNENMSNVKLLDRSYIGDDELRTEEANSMKENEYMNKIEEEKGVKQGGSNRMELSLENKQKESASKILHDKNEAEIRVLDNLFNMLGNRFEEQKTKLKQEDISDENIAAINNEMSVMKVLMTQLLKKRLEMIKSMRNEGKSETNSRNGNEEKENTPPMNFLDKEMLRQRKILLTIQKANQKDEESIDDDEKEIMIQKSKEEEGNISNEKDDSTPREMMTTPNSILTYLRGFLTAMHDNSMNKVRSGNLKKVDQKEEQVNNENVMMNFTANTEIMKDSEELPDRSSMPNEPYQNVDKNVANSLMPLWRNRKNNKAEGSVPQMGSDEHTSGDLNEMRTIVQYQNELSGENLAKMIYTPKPVEEEENLQLKTENFPMVMVTEDTNDQSMSGEDFEEPMETSLKSPVTNGHQVLPDFKNKKMNDMLSPLDDLTLAHILQEIHERGRRKSRRK